MFWNKTALTQIFYAGREPREVLPRFFFFTSNFDNPSWVEKIDKPIYSKQVSESKSIVIKRLGALGDLLMLIPVAREIKRLYPKKSLKLVANITYIKSGFLSVFNDGAFDEFVGDVMFNGIGKDEVGIDFSGVMELDHYFDEWRTVHRVDIYRKTIGLPSGTEPIWIETPFLWEEKKYVVFSSGGSWDIKTLPRDTADWICGKLKEKGYEVLHNRDEHGCRLSCQDMVDGLVNGKCLITTDSAPLWMSHFTDTPVVFLHAASRPQERVSYHPLQPEGVYCIDLAAKVNCSPCFEEMDKCQGTVPCFNLVDREWLLDEILKGIEKVAWKTESEQS